MMGDWQQATGMMIADSVAMGLVAWEVTHRQRLNVVIGGLAVSAVMKLYAVNDGVRLARRLRNQSMLERDRMKTPRDEGQLAVDIWTGN